MEYMQDNLAKKNITTGGRRRIKRPKKQLALDLTYI